MLVKDLTVNELKTMIRATVMESLAEILLDSDEGKTVNDEFKQNLLLMPKRRVTEAKSVSSKEVNLKNV